MKSFGISGNLSVMIGKMFWASILLISCERSPKAIGTDELVKNRKFNYWDEYWKPQNWNVLNTNNTDRYVVPYDTIVGVNCAAIFNNKKEPRYISQKVPVKGKQYYKITADLKMALDKVPGGLFVSDPANEKIISKYQAVYNRKKKKIQLLFWNEGLDSIELRLGFIKEGNGGNLKVCSIRLEEYKIASTFVSQSANELTKKLDLNFSNLFEFDRSIYKLARFVNSSVLEGHGKNDLNRNYLISILKKNHLNDYGVFDVIPKDIDVYDLKSSLLLKEILTMFNIYGTEVNFYKDGKRKHTLLEYFNPYDTNTYRFIDMYFSLKAQVAERNPHSIIENARLCDLNGKFSSKEFLEKRIHNTSMSSNENQFLTFQF